MKLESGMKYGYLTVLEELPKSKVKVKCDCGNEKTIDKSNLLHSTRSCGCQKYDWRKDYYKEQPKITVDYIEKRIEELRESISNLKGKTPDKMNKVEYLSFIVTNSRIIELQHLLNRDE